MSAVLAEAPQITPDQVFTPGIRTDISHSDYLAIDCFSSSCAKRLLQSPMHFKYDRENPSKDTAAKSMGTALHMGILEPERYEQEIIVLPENAPKRPSSAQLNAAKPSPSSVAAMDFWADFNLKAEGKLVLTEEQGSIVDGMVRSVRRHPIHDEMLCDGKSELTMQWEDARLRIPCKSRFDYLRDDGIALDIKSCRDASPDEFVRSVATYKYHFQEAHYRNGYEHMMNQSLRAFLFIAVENTAPYGCAVYVIESNAIRFALDRVEAAMLLYDQARKSGYWRGYLESVQPLLLPRWATSIATPTY